jgi:hypothetical protein
MHHIVGLAKTEVGTPAIRFKTIPESALESGMYGIGIFNKGFKCRFGVVLVKAHKMAKHIKTHRF